MLAIINARVLTVTGGTLEHGDILMDQGKIVAVGEGLPIPEGTRVIDGRGKWVTPGLIDAHTHIAIKEEPNTMPALGEVLENFDPITPAARALDNLNPRDHAIAAVRSAGFTTCCTLPGSGNLIGGTSVVFKTAEARTAEELVIPGKEQMKMAMGENPRRIHGTKGHSPRTRMGNAMVLREALYNARVYSDALLAAEKDPSRRPAPSFRMDALVPVVRGEMRCRIHCHRADDIVTAGRIAEEFHLKYSIEHATEGWKIADYLHERQITCVLGPHAIGPDKTETWGRRLDNPAILEKAGVNFCLTEDNRSATRFLPVYIGMMIARGLSFDTALKAVTLHPARLLEIDDRVGSIEPGKDADLAIFNGNPFSSLTLCEKTLIDGVVYDRREDVFGDTGVAD